MKHLAILLFLSLFSCLTANAQIVITKADFISQANVPMVRANYALKDTTGVAAATRALAAKSGSGQTWDISSFHFTATDTSTSEFQSGTAGVPGASDPAFSAANYASKSHLQGSIYTDWSIYNLSDNGLDILGDTQDSLGKLSSKTIYSPPFHYVMFPLQLGSQWTVGSQYDSTTVTVGGLPIKVYILSTVSFQADGEGILIRPNLSPVSCLRLKTITITKIGPIFTQYFYDTAASYSFFSKPDFSLASFNPPHTGSGPLAQYLNRTADITYTAPTQSNKVDMSTPFDFNIALSPNPAVNNNLKLSFAMPDAGTAQISVIDALGNLVRFLDYGTVSAGHNSISINITSLSPGTYFLRLYADGMTAMRKLIIAK